MSSAEMELAPIVPDSRSTGGSSADAPPTTVVSRIRVIHTDGTRNADTTTSSSNMTVHPHRLMMQSTRGKRRDLFANMENTNASSDSRNNSHSTRVRFLRTDHPAREVWNLFRVILTLFYALACPLRLCVFRAASSAPGAHRWQTSILIDYFLIDSLFILTLMANLFLFLPPGMDERTLVNNNKHPRLALAREFLWKHTHVSRSVALIDLIATIPFDLIGFLSVFGPGDITTPYESDWQRRSFVVVYALRMLRMLHIAAVFRLMESFPARWPSWNEIFSWNGNGMNGIEEETDSSIDTVSNTEDGKRKGRALLGLESVISSTRISRKVGDVNANEPISSNTNAKRATVGNAVHPAELALSSLRALDLKPLWQLVSLFLLLMHLYACLWCLVTGTSSRITAKYQTPEGENNSPGIHYMESLYFVAVTLSTVGYGDVTAQSLPEVALVMLFSLSGFLCIGGLIAYSVPLLAHTAGERHATALRDAAWQDIFDENAVHPDVQRKILGYYRHIQSRSCGMEEDAMLCAPISDKEDNDAVTEATLNYSVGSASAEPEEDDDNAGAAELVPLRYRIDLAMHIYGSILVTLPFLCAPTPLGIRAAARHHAAPTRIAPMGLLRAMVLAFKPLTYCSGDLVLLCGQRNDKIFIVAKGDVAVVTLTTIQNQKVTTKEQTADAPASVKDSASVTGVVGGEIVETVPIVTAAVDETECDDENDDGEEDPVVETVTPISCGYFGVDTFLHPELLVEADYQIVDARVLAAARGETIKGDESMSTSHAKQHHPHHHRNSISGGSGVINLSHSTFNPHPFTHPLFVGFSSHSNFADLFSLSRTDYARLAAPYPAWSVELMSARDPTWDDAKRQRAIAVQEEVSAATLDELGVAPDIAAFAVATVLPVVEPTVPLVPPTGKLNATTRLRVNSFMGSNPMISMGLQMQQALAARSNEFQNIVDNAEQKVKTSVPANPILMNSPSSVETDPMPAGSLVAIVAAGAEASVVSAADSFGLDGTRPAQPQQQQQQQLFQQPRLLNAPPRRRGMSLNAALGQQMANAIATEQMNNTSATHWERERNKQIDNHANATTVFVPISGSTDSSNVHESHHHLGQPYHRHGLPPKKNSEDDTDEDDHAAGEAGDAVVPTLAINPRSPGLTADTSISPNSIMHNSIGQWPKGTPRGGNSGSNFSFPASPVKHHWIRMLLFDPCVLVDYSSLFRRCWDGLVLLALLYTLIVLPLQAAFLNTQLQLSQSKLPFSLVLERTQSKSATTLVVYTRLTEPGSHAPHEFTVYEWSWFAVSWLFDLFFVFDLFLRCRKFRAAKDMAPIIVGGSAVANTAGGDALSPTDNSLTAGIGGRGGSIGGTGAQFMRTKSSFGGHTRMSGSISSSSTFEVADPSLLLRAESKQIGINYRKQFAFWLDLFAIVPLETLVLIPGISSEW
jgi:hypothetical protein